MLALEIGAPASHAAVRETTFVASTPCDAAIRPVVGVPRDVTCDFIRWHLSLQVTPPRRFSLTINFGEAQPNTLGFIGGGRTVTFDGMVEVVRQTGRGEPAAIYRLDRSTPAPSITFLEVNGNLLHLLDRDGHLQVGDGGWSYTLNREPPIPSAPNPFFWLVSGAVDDVPVHAVFEGRTPCREIAPRIGLAAETGCFKVKWKLTLNRDPRTHEPTTYALERTGHRDAPIEGRWVVASDGRANGRPVTYQLDPDSPATSLSFLAVGDAVLFFLDERGRLLTGNGDFSYTLNRHVN